MDCFVRSASRNDERGLLSAPTTVIASHPVGAKRRRMTGSAKQSLRYHEMKRINGLLMSGTSLC
ncbi:hypothetical protein CWO89_23575 [Bradyrhizobium sp. Leo170]|nr:hypothetical protein CWO89_23575 [Bradyrhizobium sp. Leo170]